MRSVPEFQAAGTTQWSIPKPEQPLGPNNSKSSPSRPFRLSHITQTQKNGDVCWNLLSLGRHQQKSCCPAQVLHGTTEAKGHLSAACPKKKKPQATTTIRKARGFMGPVPVCTGAASHHGDTWIAAGSVLAPGHKAADAISHSSVMQLSVRAGGCTSILPPPHPKASCSYWQNLLAKCRVPEGEEVWARRQRSPGKSWGQAGNRMVAQAGGHRSHQGSIQL